MNLYDAHATIDRLTRENAVLRQERDAARRVVGSLAERVARQSELLTQKSVRVGGDQVALKEAQSDE